MNGNWYWQWMFISRFSIFRIVWLSFWQKVWQKSILWDFPMKTLEDCLLTCKKKTLFQTQCIIKLKTSFRLNARAWVQSCFKMVSGFPRKNAAMPFHTHIRSQLNFPTRSLIDDNGTSMYVSIELRSILFLPGFGKSMWLKCCINTAHRFRER